MANTLKCIACNIVIDELLAYLQNKLSVCDEESLKRICVSAFNSDEISKSKTMLFESLPTDQRKITRKRKGKEDRDLDDIISLLKSVDPDKIPLFVARDLERLPPILFDHLDCTKLLKDLTRLNAEIEEVKNTYASVKQIEELWSCIQKLKYASLPPSINPADYVNMRRGGAWNVDSGPIGLTLSHNYSTDELNLQRSQNNLCSIDPDAPILTTVCDNNSGTVCTPLAELVAMPCVDFVTTPAPAAGSAQLLEVRKGVECCNQQVPGVSVAPTESTMSTKSVSIMAQGGEETERYNSHGPRNTDELIGNDNENSPGWKTVSNRKRKQGYRYLGERGKAGATISSFKAAVKKMTIFITNVPVDTVASDIVDYIEVKTQETVSLENFFMTIKREKSNKCRILAQFNMVFIFTILTFHFFFTIM